MSFITARTPEQIRDDLLAYLRTRFAAVGLTVQTVKGSHMWNLASALGVIQAAIDANAASLTAQILPDQATGNYLDRHGAVQGLPREQATSAQIEFGGRGSPDGVVSLGSSTVQSPAGARFIPNTTTVTVTGGNYTVICTAQTPGSAGNLPVSTLCSWSTPPTNLASALTAAFIEVVGTDAELDPEFQQRLILNLQERPASGNRADWQEWAEAVDGVTEAFVYPLLPPTNYTTAISSAAVPGTLTVVCLGPQATLGGVIAAYPAHGTGIFDPSFSRLVSNGTLNNVAGYIEGTNDVHGVAVASSVPNTQLRPVTVVATNYGIETPTAASANLALSITCTKAYPPTSTQQFGVTAATAVSSGITTLTVTPAIADAALVAGVQMLLTTTSGNRGNVEVVTIHTTPTQGTFSIVVANCVGTPITTSSGKLGPWAPNFPFVLGAILNYADSLGPGDVNIGAGADPLQHRWPPQDSEGRGTVYPSEIVAAIMAPVTGDAAGTPGTGAPGIVDTVVTSPGSSVTYNTPNMFVPPFGTGTAIEIKFIAESN